MKMGLTCICIIAFAFLSCSNVVTPKKCMLIGAAEGEENAEFDQYIIPQLEAWGYVVDIHHSKDLSSYTEEDYAPYDFIFLSETTNSSDMSPLQEIPKPMLCSDGWGAKESALAFGTGEPVGIIEPAKPVIFLDESEGHILAAGYAPGTVVELGAVEDSLNPCLIVWGKPTIPFIPIVGVEDDPAQIIVYGIEKGTKNVSDVIMKNRVAVVGVHAWGYDDLTEAGEKLFKAGINWIVE